jgi:hypothetical protein
MIAVAILAVTAGTIEGLRRRRESCERRARMFARKASAEIMAEQAYRVSRRGSQFDYDPWTTAAHFQLVEYYSALREKYDQAAARPWLLVAPDPPEPAWPPGVPRDGPSTRGRD